MCLPFGLCEWGLLGCVSGDFWAVRVGHQYFLAQPHYGVLDSRQRDWLPGSTDNFSFVGEPWNSWNSLVNEYSKSGRV